MTLGSSSTSKYVAGESVIGMLTVFLEKHPFLFQNYFTWGLQLDLEVRNQGGCFFTQGFESILSFCSLQM